MITEESVVQTIDGVVEDIIFRNSVNGYVVLDLNTGSDYVTVVGELGNVEEGEDLEITGSFTSHPKFGMQFKAQVYERKLPATTSSILKYLSSGVIKGIGKTTAKRIVDEFGDKSLEIIEKEPEKLTAIKGITKQKVEDISLEFQRICGIRALMIFLSKYGVSPSIAVGAWRKWGQFAIEVIQDNPYALCNFGIELEFEKAEFIASELKLPTDSDNRIKAGIFHVLYQNTFSGHVCLPYDRLKKKTCSLLCVDEEKFDNCLEYEKEEENIVIYNKNDRDFVYIQEFYRAENYITGRLAVMNDCLKDSGTDYDKLIEIEEKVKDITYAALQKKAISLALSKGFIILTGGPGTGKTTTLKAIISLYEQKGMKVMIAAPTGRAAKRISDLTGYDAKTIHRLLEVAFDNRGMLKFKHDESNPVACDVMIVDEMSMVDTLLFEALLRALKLSCRLIMVGDSDQLPSVGPGNLLKDMIDSNKLTVVQLNEIFRQASKSCIIMNAHKIVNGENPDLTKTDNDFFFMQRLDYQTAQGTVIDLCKERLVKAYNFSPVEDIQVLCPSRKGALGVTELNKLLQQAINPPASNLAEIKASFYLFRDNDKVMQTKNNYDITWSKDGEAGAGIFNGDIGIIVKVKRNESTVVIDFEGRIAEYSYEMLEQLELAYAITVHKSQGSEFNAVILPLLGGFDKLFYRNLLYTAVTRAKKMLIIVGSGKVVEQMVANNRRSLRYSCLKDMLEKELG